MTTWILWLITTLVIGNPLVALLIVLAIIYLGQAQFTGRYVRPIAFLQSRREIAGLRITLETNPEDASAHNDLGRILALKGIFVEALPHLEKAHRRSPEAVETAFFYGYTRLALGEEDEGLALIEEALEKKPRMRYGEPYLLTGDVYEKRGRWDAAIPWYETFTRLNTESVEGFYKLGRCYAEMGRAGDARAAFAGAVAAYRQAPRYIRRSARPWYWKSRWRRAGLRIGS
jgi:tetratricopeptide (TPR) repeat protein